MKQGHIYIGVCLISFALLGTCFAQNVQNFQHPALNFQVQAFDTWLAVPHPENHMIFEIQDPESVVHVLMWYTEAAGSGTGYLKNFARQKKFVFDADPVLGKIKERDAWVLDATCCMNESPVRVVLVAIPWKNDVNCFYVAQVVCPENQLQEKESTIEQIIYSLDITD